MISELHCTGQHKRTKLIETHYSFIQTKQGNQDKLTSYSINVIYYIYHITG